MTDRRRELEYALRRLRDSIAYYERMLAKPDPDERNYHRRLEATQLRAARGKLLANAVQRRYEWETELQKIALDEWRTEQAALDACDTTAGALA